MAVFNRKRKCSFHGIYIMMVSIQRLKLRQFSVQMHKYMVERLKKKSIQILLFTWRVQLSCPLCFSSAIDIYLIKINYLISYRKALSRTFFHICVYIRLV